MSKEPLRNKNDSETKEYFGSELGKYFQGVEIHEGALKKGFFEVKKESGRLKITLDTAKIPVQRREKYLAHIVGYLESIQSLGKLKANTKDSGELQTFLKNSKNGYYTFFYNFIYRQIGIHRAHVSPRDRRALQKMSESHIKSLETKYSPIPKHIQLLIGISGKQVQDNEVEGVLGALRGNNILQQLIDPRIDEKTRLVLIHTYILPQYEYFLSQDKKNWKNTKTPRDTIDDIVKSTKQAAEEIQDDSPPEEPKEEETTSPETENDVPDYRETYDTPEGGKFEKGNTKNQGIEISPGLKGYFAMDQKNHFDRNTLKWTNTFPTSPAIINSQFSGKRYRFKAQFASPGKKALPLPYGYTIDTQSAQLTGSGGNFIKDTVGNFFYENTGKTSLEVDFCKDDTFRETPPVAEDTQKLFSSSLSSVAMQALRDAENEQDIREKIRILRDYITSHHFYPPGKNETETNDMALKLQKHLQDISNGADYFFHLDTSTHLECYSANSLFVAMLRHIGLSARLATGHHVQSLAKNGNSYLTSGNGHGWTMVWDGTSWIRFDATPAKDPQDPRNKKDPKEKEEEEGEGEGSEGEDADDGGEDTPGEGNGDEDQEGNQGGKSSSGGKQKGKTGSGQGSKNGEEKADYGEVGPGERTEDDFEKMYDELGKGEENPESGSPGEEQEKEEDTQELEDLIDAEAKEIERQEEEKRERGDPQEREIRRRYPQLSPEEVKRLAQFMKEFQKDLEKISQLQNPLWKEGSSEHKTLEEALKAIFDRVVSRRIKEREVPRHPVTEGDTMIDPVTLYIDRSHGITDSYSFQTTGIEQEEELKIVKVRKRKILDASGSMDGQKLRTQQMIEVLENKVTADKQRELNEISESLSRDLRLETETWQFGTRRSSSAGFTLLKPLGSDFSLIEQSAIWNLAGVSEGGTNDFDPLEAIYKSLEDEQAQEGREKPYDVSVLQRIRMGFLIREREALRRLESNEKRTTAEEIHYRNLTEKNNKKVQGNIARFIPRQEDGNIDMQMLSPEERNFFTSLSLEGKSIADIFEQWLEVLREKDRDIEPILEIVEVSSDGGSDNPERLRKILGKLRSLGVIVIAYGLGNDGKAVEQVYKNDFNPDEGGNYCQNLLDYPRAKMQSWNAILDTI